MCRRGGGTAAHKRVSSDSGSRSTATVPSENAFFSAMRTSPSDPRVIRSRTMGATAAGTPFLGLAFGGAAIVGLSRSVTRRGKPETVPAEDAVIDSATGEKIVGLREAYSAESAWTPDPSVI